MRFMAHTCITRVLFTLLFFRDEGWWWHIRNLNHKVESAKYKLLKFVAIRIKKCS